MMKKILVWISFILISANIVLAQSQLDDTLSSLPKKNSLYIIFGAALIIFILAVLRLILKSFMKKN